MLSESRDELFLEPTRVLMSLLVAASLAKSAPYLCINMRAICATHQLLPYLVMECTDLGEFRAVFKIGRGINNAADRLVHVKRTRTVAKIRAINSCNRRTFVQR